MIANRHIFGITGGSGAGKSFVAELFRKEGVTVTDCDKIAREVTLPNGEAYAELMEKFGKEYFDGNGFLNRKKLAELVFSDKKQLDILNSVTHKHIKSRIENALADVSIAAVDGAVIIGSPVEKMCEFLVGVTAPYEKRLERITMRDDITENAARQRLAAQPDEEFYRQHCRYIIENDGRDIEGEVKKILKDMKWD